MTTFILLRHGQTDWNLNHRYQGTRDIPLNATGEQQAREAHELIMELPFADVYCSDLDRARTTAKLVLGDIFPMEKVHFDRRLRERSFGVFEGGPFDRERMPLEYIRAMDADPNHFKFPEGESLIDVTERVRPFYQEIREKYPDQAVLVVAHGTLLSMLSGVILHEPVDNRTRRHLLNAAPMIFNSID